MEQFKQMNAWTFAFLVVILFWVVNNNTQLDKIQAEFEQPTDIEWIYKLVPTEMVYECPCAWEIWSTVKIDGEVQEDDWYIVGTQDDCDVMNKYLNE